MQNSLKDNNSRNISTSSSIIIEQPAEKTFESVEKVAKTNYQSIL